MNCGSPAFCFISLYMYIVIYLFVLFQFSPLQVKEVPLNNCKFGQLPSQRTQRISKSKVDEFTWWSLLNRSPLLENPKIERGHPAYLGNCSELGASNPNPNREYRLPVSNGTSQVLNIFGCFSNWGPLSPGRRCPFF